MQRNIILGIHWEQKSGAALGIDGELISALSEERCSNIKNDERYPYNAIERILQRNNIRRENIGTVAIASKEWSPEYSLRRHYSKTTVEQHVKDQYEYWKPKLLERKNVNYLELNYDKLDFAQYPGERYWMKVVREAINMQEAKRELFYKEIRREVVRRHLGNVNIVEVEHTACHAAAGLLFEKDIERNTAIITLDGWGDGANHSIRVVKEVNGKYKVRLLMREGTSEIARIYRYATLALGMKPNEHEYKIMGLAPYANERYIGRVVEKLNNITTINGIRFERAGNNADTYFFLKEIFEGERFDNIAGGLQKFVENKLIEWFSNIARLSPKKIIYCGGVAMNVKANMLIKKLMKSKNIGLSVPLAPDDTSQCIGAAYSIVIGLDKDHNDEEIELNIRKESINTSAYLGIEQKVNIDYIKEALISSNYKLSELNVDVIVKDLAEGGIYARWEGKEEFGARALGNRSVIADPSKMINIEKINSTIKNRDFWMPFACTILDKYANLYLKLDGPIEDYKYMTICAETVEEQRWKIKAGTHPQDGTCRPQIIRKKDNEEYYKLIEAFGEKTNIYSLLNTSLNIHGKPIASSIEDALEVLEKGNMAGLVINNKYMVRKNG